jgi:glutathione S-transferase
MLELYYTPGTCALASHIALEESGADFTLTRVRFSSAEQKGEAYRRINPKGRVPALVTDRGVLTETPAILAYIAQAYPAAALAPLDDAFASARAQAFNAYLCATVHVAHAHRVRGARWADDEATIAGLKRAAPRAIGEVFALIETTLLEGPWVLGEAYSICDPYLFTLAQWIEADGVDPERLPRVMAHRRRVAERPAVQRALAAEGAAGA